MMAKDMFSNDRELPFQNSFSTRSACWRIKYIVAMYQKNDLFKLMRSFKVTVDLIYDSIGLIQTPHNAIDMQYKFTFLLAIF